jgi:hypothetical protein
MKNQDAEEMKADVYTSPLFLKKSLAASLKGLFQGINLMQDVRKSSPSKLSPMKNGSHHLLVDEERKTDNSVGIRDLEG